MKHFIKIMAVCLAAALMMTFFAACAPSAEELAGTYTGSYVYNGNDFTCAIVINENGTYGKATMKNGELSSSEAGDWEIKGNKVRLYTDDSAAG